MNFVSATHVLRTDTFSSDTVYLHGEKHHKLDEQVKQLYDLESFGMKDKKREFIKNLSKECLVKKADMK